jgi:hypothetical protein
MVLLVVAIINRFKHLQGTDVLIVPKRSRKRKYPDGTVEVVDAWTEFRREAAEVLDAITTQTTSRFALF